MGIANALKALGGKLGIIRIVTAQGGDCSTQPCKVSTRTVTIQDLTTEVRRDEVKALAELPAELSVTFDRVCEAAGVKAAPHGWTIDRLIGLMRTDQYKTMDRESVQKAVLGLLTTEKAQVEDLVKDAMARDQSVDAYETFVRDKMEEREAARTRRVAEIEAQIADLQQERTKQAEESKADREQWDRWLERKTGYEKDMAWALGFLLDRPVVTITKSGVRK